MNFGSISNRSTSSIVSIQGKQPFNPFFQKYQNSKVMRKNWTFPVNYMSSNVKSPAYLDKFLSQTLHEALKFRNLWRTTKTTKK